MKTTYRIVDLFAGIGGLKQGVIRSIESHGSQAETVFTSEIKKEAVATLQANFPNLTITGDITQVSEVDIPAHDILLAGFPCQAFSYAGNREGFNDETRGTLFFDVARILAHHKPQYFILENVEGLVTHDLDPITKEGRTLQTILQVLSAFGYEVHWGVLNATDYGVPQARKRVILTGSLSDTPQTPQPDLASLLTLNPSEPLVSILEVGVTETDVKLNNFADLLKLHYPDLTVLEGKIFRDWRGGARNIHSWNIHYKGTTTAAEKALMESLMVEAKRSHWAVKGLQRKGEGFPLTREQIAEVTLTPLEVLTPMLNNLAQMGYLRYEAPTYRIASGQLSMPLTRILDQSGYSVTLTATDADRQCLIDSGELRRFTDLEVKRLFGFPDDYIIPPTVRRAKMFDLFGNTVVIPVAEAVADWLLWSDSK